jgi:hypothetical protein
VGGKTGELFLWDSLKDSIQARTQINLLACLFSRFDPQYDLAKSGTVVYTEHHIEG